MTYISLTKLCVCCLILISFIVDGQAQYNEVIRTARPGQAVGPFTVGQSVFQIQTGIGLSEYSDSNGNDGDAFEYTSSFRYGLYEKFELRSAIRYRVDHRYTNMETLPSREGVSFWNVGVRYNLFNNPPKGPNIGIQTDIKLNWIDEDFKSEAVSPRIMLIHSQRFSKLFALTTNWSLTLDGNTNDVFGNYVINISFPISKKLSSFVESYGSLNNGDLDAHWDTGFGYFISNNFQIDISSGFGMNERRNDWFIDSGISWRIKLK